MNTAPWIQNAYGIVTSALRDDEQALRAGFEGLTATQSADVAQAALLAMAVIVRDCVQPEHIDDLVAAVQAVATQDAAAE